MLLLAAAKIIIITTMLYSIYDTALYVYIYVSSGSFDTLLHTQTESLDVNTSYCTVTKNNLHTVSLSLSEAGEKEASRKMHCMLQE